MSGRGSTVSHVPTKESGLKLTSSHQISAVKYHHDDANGKDGSLEAGEGQLPVQQRDGDVMPHSYQLV